MIQCIGAKENIVEMEGAGFEGFGLKGVRWLRYSGTSPGGSVTESSEINRLHRAEGLMLDRLGFNY